MSDASAFHVREKVSFFVLSFFLSFFLFFFFFFFFFFFTFVAPSAPMDYHVKFSLMPKIDPICPDEDFPQLSYSNFTKTPTVHKEEVASLTYPEQSKVWSPLARDR